MVAARVGEVLVSRSGRELSKFPGGSVKKVDAWLLKEAKLEANGEDYLSHMLSLLNPKKLTVSDRDILNDILFD